MFLAVIVLFYFKVLYFSSSVCIKKHLASPFMAPNAYLRGNTFSLSRASCNGSRQLWLLHVWVSINPVWTTQISRGLKFIFVLMYSRNSRILKKTHYSLMCCFREPVYAGCMSLFGLYEIILETE